MQEMPNEICTSIDSYKQSGKGMWDQIQRMMMGIRVGTRLKKTNCTTSYENFKAKDSKNLEETYERFSGLLNQLSKNEITKTKIENNVKFLSICNLKRKVLLLISCTKNPC